MHEKYVSPFEFLSDIKHRFGTDLMLFNNHNKPQHQQSDFVKDTYTAYRLIEKVMKQFRTIKVGP
jgi:hypothetical protein